MLDFMQDDADDIVVDTTSLHKGTGLSVCINHCLFAFYKYPIEFDRYICTASRKTAIS